MNHPFQIDGQRQPKQPEPELRLRDPDILQLPQPLCCEIDMSVWKEHDGWLDTEPDQLRSDHATRL